MKRNSFTTFSKIAVIAQCLLVLQLSDAQNSAQTSGPVTNASLEQKGKLLTAGVLVEKETKTKPYSPMIFGGFLEHFGNQIYGGVFEPGSPLSDENGFRKDVIAALKELKVSIVRWPGGCFASGYHWYYGAGKERKPTDDMAWGVIESNAFGTDEFVKLCRLVGWTPYICNNAGNGTVDEMRDWVEYCNGRQGRFAVMRKENGNNEPHNVPIWSIGNENWGKHEIGYKPIEQWATLVRQAAEAMKAADPNIKLTAAALPTREWTIPLLKQAGSYLDYISIHLYSLGLWLNNDTPDYMTCIMKSQDAEKLIVNYIGVLEESGYRGRIKIALDEWNLRGWHHPGFPRKTVQDYNDPEIIKLVAAREKNLIASQYTIADALYSASVLNSCLRYCDDVGMSNIAPLVNTRGPLFVHPKGVVKRTTFHTLAMYANLLKSRFAASSVNSEVLVHNGQSIPAVDAIVTTDESGTKWSIAIVNRHPSQDVSCTIKIGDILLEGRYDAAILTGDTITSYNDIEHPNSVSPKKTQIAFTKGVGRLSPHSLTILQVTTD